MTTPTSQLTPGPRFQPITKPITHAWFDVDNTLVGNVSPKLPSDAFIEAAHASGKRATLALATARPLQKAKHIIEAAKLEGISIIGNGSQLYDGKTGKIVEELPLPVDVTQEIVRDLQDMGLAHWVQDDGIDHFFHEGDAYAKQVDIWQPLSETNREIVPAYVPVTPFVIVAHKVSAESARQLHDVARKYTDQHVTSLIAHEYTENDGNASFDLFFIDDRANKKHALHSAVALSGANHDQTLAVGDGHNDIVIIENAGVGVAMGNAVPETKAVATYIAPDWDEDGAAVVLSELVLKNET